MAEYFSFLNRMRQDLGKSYTVAEEHTADSLRVNVLVRRQRHDETLCVDMDARWLAQLDNESELKMGTDYRTLTTLIGSFFSHPDALPSHTFAWPGTSDTRDLLRHRLVGRRRASTT